jgi:glyoxylase-like metal-dependent hydrolase (beta-lactamase superfamily II)
MAGPLRHLGELARTQVGKRAAARADGEALEELEARPLELPPGLEVEWLGVSGYRLTYEGQTLFVDPYLSRVPLRDLLLRRRALPDPAALERFIRAPGKTVGVLVGHTHFDHAVDAPELARRLDCKAYGRPRW